MGSSTGLPTGPSFVTCAGPSTKRPCVTPGTAPSHGMTMLFTSHSPSPHSARRISTGRTEDRPLVRICPHACAPLGRIGP